MITLQAHLYVYASYISLSYQSPVLDTVIIPLTLEGLGNSPKITQLVQSQDLNPDVSDLKGFTLLARQSLPCFLLCDFPSGKPFLLPLSIHLKPQNPIQQKKTSQSFCVSYGSEVQKHTVKYLFHISLSTFDDNYYISFDSFLFSEPISFNYFS